MFDDNDDLFIPDHGAPGVRRSHDQIVVDTSCNGLVGQELVESEDLEEYNGIYIASTRDPLTTDFQPLNSVFYVVFYNKDRAPADQGVKISKGDSWTFSATRIVKTYGLESLLSIRFDTEGVAKREKGIAERHMLTIDEFNA